MESSSQAGLFISNSSRITFIYSGIEDPFPMLSNPSTHYSTELPFTPKLFDKYLSWQCRFAKTL